MYVPVFSLMLPVVHVWLCVCPRLIMLGCFSSLWQTHRCWIMLRYFLSFSLSEVREEGYTRRSCERNVYFCVVYITALWLLRGSG